MRPENTRRRFHWPNSRWRSGRKSLVPITPMSLEDMEKEPEVPEEHHLNLCLFAGGACLTRTANIDSGLRSLGREWMASWADIVAKAKRDKQRLGQSMPQFRFGGWVNDRTR